MPGDLYVGIQTWRVYPVGTCQMALVEDGTKKGNSL